ncbi:DUF86 domain-containing protein [Clostridium tarantellae]|uniref:DUF86 domain-containing protein n=1 Tax=Clostridium tarantellae TaxID=39493 RepID=A0A6I1MMV0_9CLOT|nr:HepT-like ribonuclease domain-containing protein [Clostridium tarantellae]MPQ44354.1 DUF86 domain-containing protein [Clostridium tarantellae]
MNLDKERITREVLFLNNNIKKLNKLNDLSKIEFLTDFRNIDSTKYLLKSSVESMINLCNYIIIGNQWGLPENSLNTFEIIIKNSRENKIYISNYEKLILLKDKISYGYYNINDDEIYEELNNHSSIIEKFIFFINDFI